ncbi:MAG: cadherin domain-containing protein, partial [Trichodesmium sp. St19_bin1]|nr:cadherin domain-containing protein [Trichodesmium sp. St19_bin1]
VRITDRVGARDGSDTLKDVEKAEFSDKTIDISPGQDISFVIDTTGSMNDDIDAVKARASEIINTIFDSDRGFLDSQIAVVGYKDPSTNTFLSFTEQPKIEDRKNAAIKAINSISVGGGGDEEEAVNAGLIRALSGGAGEWREEADVRRIILFGDAPPKDTELRSQVLKLAANVGVNSSNRKALSITGDIETSSITSDLSITRFALATENSDGTTVAIPVEIFSVLMGNDWIEDTYFQSLAEADFQSLADETGGKLFNADNASQVVDVLIEAIQTPIDDNQAPTALKLDNKTINENEPDNSLIGNFSTTDLDSGNNFTYELVTGDGDTDNKAFTINNDQLKINDSPNYENQSSYSIRVKTTDEEGASLEKQLIINVNDVNETPTDLDLDNKTIDENVAPQSVVGKFSTIDPDQGDSSTYELVTDAVDTDNSAFSINSDQQLQINDSPDFETKSSYSIRVKTTDGGGASLEKPLTINVNDVYEGIPLALAMKLEAEEAAKLAAERAAKPTSDPDIETILTSILPDEPILPIVDFNTTPSLPPGEKTFTGTSDSDSYIGNEDDNLMYGNGGSDILIGNQGEDVIYAGKDKDTVYGNEDNDSIFGNNDDDILIGNKGDDYLNGNKDNDTIYGSEGKDTINGGKNDDNIYGGIDNDSINGDKGKDVLIGEEGDDILNGGLGNDLLYGGLGNNTLSGGQGSDSFILTAFEGTNRITDFDNEDTLTFVGFSSEEIELVSNISENMTNIILNSKIIAILENTQIINPNDLNFIE